MAQEKRVCVVTGALGSIGAAICAGLAREGHRVVMVVRDPKRAQPTRDQLAQATGNDAIELQQCDLGSTASIRHAAAELAKKHPKIHALVNNAAAFSKERKTTADGFELQMGTNLLSMFLLTHLLEQPLKAAQGRVVVMGMPSKTPIQFDDLMLEKKYDGMTAYGMSKAATLYFTRELAERWKGQVTVNAVDPGMVKTTLIKEAPFFIRAVFALAATTPEKGAETALYVATSPEVEGVTGQFFGKKKAKPFPPGSEDAAARAKLWELSAKLVGLRA